MVLAIKFCNAGGFEPCGAHQGEAMANLNRVQKAVRYDFVYIDQESFDKYKPNSFITLVEGFREYKENALTN